jgi:hypothetical protein
VTNTNRSSFDASTSVIPAAQLGALGVSGLTFVIEVETFVSGAGGGVRVARSPTVQLAASTNSLSGGSNSDSNSTGQTTLVILIVVLVLGIMFVALFVASTQRKKSDVTLSKGPVTVNAAFDMQELHRKLFEEDDADESLQQPQLPTIQHGTTPTEYWEYGSDDRTEQFYPAEGMPQYAMPSAGGYLDVKPRPEFYDPSGSHLSVLPGTPAVAQRPEDQLRDGYLSAFRGTAVTETSIDAIGITASIAKMLQTGELDEQFSRIKDEGQHSTATFEAANDPINLRKNRYSNIKPIDMTRVRLASSGQPGDDYINANYVDGWRRPRAFSAADHSRLLADGVGSKVGCHCDGDERDGRRQAQVPSVLAQRRAADPSRQHRSHPHRPGQLEP